MDEAIASRPASVVRYRPGLQPAFESLNRRWIETFFAMEPRDEAVLKDPEGEIIARGGEVFFVLDGNEAAVGTCALLPAGPGTWYLAKMAVHPEAQGRGYSHLLLRAAIDWARGRGGTRITLTSNRVLATALALYRKYGFREVPLEPGDAEYVRVDIRMELAL